MSSKSCAETKTRSAKSQLGAVSKLCTVSESAPVGQSLRACLEETLIVCFKRYAGVLNGAVDFLFFFFFFITASIHLSSPKFLNGKEKS